MVDDSKSMQTSNLDFSGMKFRITLLDQETFLAEGLAKGNWNMEWITEEGSYEYLSWPVIETRSPVAMDIFFCISFRCEA